MFLPGMSAAVTMVNSSQGRPSGNVMPFRSARGSLDRTVTPCRVPGRVWSAV